MCCEKFVPSIIEKRKKIGNKRLIANLFTEEDNLLVKPLLFIYVIVVALHLHMYSGAHVTASGLTQHRQDGRSTHTAVSIKIRKMSTILEEFFADVPDQQYFSRIFTRSAVFFRYSNIIGKIMTASRILSNVSDRMREIWTMAATADIDPSESAKDLEES